MLHRALKSADSLVTDSKRLQLNGSEVHYFEIGSGEPVILIHGVPADSRTWRFNADVLASEFRVLSVDLPSWGRSKSAADFNNSLGNLASHLADFARALDIDQSSLVATGAGAVIALELALAHPDTTNALVLSSVPWGPNETPLHLSIPSGFVAREAFKRGAKRSVRRIVKQGYVEPTSIDPSIVDAYAYPLTKGPGVTALTQLHKSLVDRLPFPETELAKVQAPTLVVHGAKDRLCPRAHADRLATLIPNAVLASIEHGGHFVHEELPAAYNNLALEHLRLHRGQ